MLHVPMTPSRWPPFMERTAAPGTAPDLEPLLMRLRRPHHATLTLHCGWVPLIRAPTVEPPSAQPMYERERETGWYDQGHLHRGDRNNRRPQSRLDYLRLEATYLRAIRGLSEIDIAKEYELAPDEGAEYPADESPGAHFRRNPNEPQDDPPRLWRSQSRQARARVRAGGLLMAQLGAWPWAVFQTPLPHAWRGSQAVDQALTRWLDEGGPLDGSIAC